VPAEQVEPLRAEPLGSDRSGVADDLRAIRTPACRSARLSWEQGTDRDYLQGWIGYWAEAFGWRVHERELDCFAQYRAEIDGLRPFRARATVAAGDPAGSGSWLAGLLHELLPLVPLRPTLRRMASTGLLSTW
jgi:hypothetical protein